MKQFMKQYSDAVVVMNIGVTLHVYLADTNFSQIYNFSQI